MKNIPADAFLDIAQSLCDSDREALKAYFDDFRIHCLIAKKEKRKLRQDVENAIVYYINSGKTLTEALKLLGTEHFGGFYARPPVMWFPLDDAAKIYPLSMEHGHMSIFRLSVYLKSDVIPELLQMALNFTIKRFPSFATTLKKGVFWHYLDTTKRRFTVEEERDVPCRPMAVSRSGSQSFRVLHYNNRISCEFFHVLTDGTGGMTFLKVLTAEYLRLTGVKITPDESLWDCSETPSAEEFENAFSRIPKEKTASGFVDKPAVQLSGALAKNIPCRVLHFKMDISQLKSAAQKYGATVTAYVTAKMFLAAQASTDEMQGDLSIQIPVNMRKFYPSKTVRNFSMYCGVRLPVHTRKSMRELTSSVTEQLHEKASKRAMTQMLTATRNLVSSVRYVPLYIKQPVAKTVYGFLGDKIFTTTLSNLGMVKLPPEVSEHIESMDFILGTNTINRVSCSMVSINSTATFSVAKLTADPTFEETMYKLLLEDGIDVIVEGSEVYGY